MKEEFNLSEKAGKGIASGWYPKKDVKEFIKRLKEQLKVHEKVNHLIVNRINKLAGDELI